MQDNNNGKTCQGKKCALEISNFSLRTYDVVLIVRADTKGLSTNNLGKIALRFGLDLVAAIEQNRRRSSATLRIL
jgi:hypothetical protein